MRTLTSIILLFISITLFSQELKPTETKALLNFLVTDLDGFPKNKEIVIAVDVTSNIEYTAQTNEDGKCGILVPKGRRYKIKYLDLIEKTNYSDFDVPNKFGLMSFNIQIKFEPSSKINIDEIEFKENSTNLTLKATDKLDTVANILLTKKIKIEIAAHTDNLLNQENALKLTQDRADVIKNYLISKGVETSKLESKGYGFSEPINDNKTSESRKKNNRIELRIKQQYF
jgi:outer membrane protein OmpA-like peptidoglycan-associated protein